MRNGRRVGKLYGPGRYFLCRHCYRLAHASQSENVSDRALRRANKIRKRLGGDAGTDAPFPRRLFFRYGHLACQHCHKAVYAELWTKVGDGVKG